jgi:parallel beta-helix repeat protein
MNCTGDGLIVGSDNIVINLNGHSINGPGDSSSKVGISVPHDTNVKIKGSGAIRNYQAGVLISGSQNTEVSRITLEGNKIAVFITGSKGTTVEQNLMYSNAIGLASHSSGNNQIHSNAMTANELAGVTFVNTPRSQIDNNTISGSRNGIYLDYVSTQNSLSNNNVHKNDIDINNADGASLSDNDNELSKNSCSISNPSGICKS